MRKMDKQQFLIGLILFAVVLSIGLSVRYYLTSYQELTTPVTLLQRTSPEIEPGAVIFNEPKITDDTKHLVPLDTIVSGGPSQDGVPSIDNPSFVSVEQANRYIQDDTLGLAVVSDDISRFYPYQILVWHEIINDTFNSTPIAVTYDPISKVGAVYKRSLENIGTVEFGFSGKLWNSNLLLYDRATESYWSQLLGLSISGDLTKTPLDPYPSLYLSYADWKNNFPNGEVLSINTGYSRDYQTDPYKEYYTTDSIYFPIYNTDSRLERKDIILALNDPLSDSSKAYDLEAIKREGVINDVFNNTNIVILWHQEANAPLVFERNDVEFKLSESGMESNRGSLYNFDGNKISGEGPDILKPYPYKTSFWFSWVSAYPETELYK